MGAAFADDPGRKAAASGSTITHRSRKDGPPKSHPAMNGQRCQRSKLGSCHLDGQLKDYEAT